MLQLDRKCDEAIVIGEAGTVLTGPITVFINQIKGNRVKLGIDAPPSVVIQRGENVGVIREVPRAPGK